MNFSIQLTRGPAYTGIGPQKTLALRSAVRASEAAKDLLLDARVKGAESPDGYVIFDADGEWTERYRIVTEAGNATG